MASNVFTKKKKKSPLKCAFIVQTRKTLIIPSEILNSAGYPQNTTKINIKAHQYCFCYENFLTPTST